MADDKDKLTLRERVKTSDSLLARGIRWNYGMKKRSIAKERKESEELKKQGYLKRFARWNWDLDKKDKKLKKDKDSYSEGRYTGGDETTSLIKTSTEKIVNEIKENRLQILYARKDIADLDRRLFRKLDGLQNILENLDSSGSGIGLPDLPDLGKKKNNGKRTQQPRDRRGRFKARPSGLGIGSKVLSAGGKAIPLLGAGLEGYNEYQETGSLGRAAGVGAGALAGGAAGAKGGAALGGAIGALFFGAGAVPGALIGGAVGGIGGSILGAFGARKVMNTVSQSPNTVTPPVNNSNVNANASKTEADIKDVVINALSMAFNAKKEIVFKSDSSHTIIFRSPHIKFESDFVQFGKDGKPLKNLGFNAGDTRYGTQSGGVSTTPKATTQAMDSMTGKPTAPIPGSVTPSAESIGPGGVVPGSRAGGTATPTGRGGSGRAGGGRTGAAAAPQMSDAAKAAMEALKKGSIDESSPEAAVLKGLSPEQLNAMGIKVTKNEASDFAPSKTTYSLAPSQAAAKVAAMSNEEIARNLATGSGSMIKDAKGRVISTASTNMPAHQRALLDTLAMGNATSGGNYWESPDYNTIVGKGGKFQSYKDHPRVFGTATSTAAGRYQFTKTTWDDVVKQFNMKNRDNPITDFSPQNQDRAAWFLAQRDYSKRTRGRSLDEDLKSGMPVGDLIKQGLGGFGKNTTWEILQRKSGQEIQGAFTANLERNREYASRTPGQTPTPEAIAAERQRLIQQGQQQEETQRNQAWAQNLPGQRASTGQASAGTPVGQQASIPDRTSQPGDFAQRSRTFEMRNGYIHSSGESSQRNIGQCASLSKAFNPNVGRASNWTVRNDLPIKPGTMVASMAYGGGRGGVAGGKGYHTGIAMTAPDRNGNFYILDQWAKGDGKPAVRLTNVNSSKFNAGQMGIGVVQGSKISLEALKMGAQMAPPEVQAQIQANIRQLESSGGPRSPGINEAALRQAGIPPTAIQQAQQPGQEAGTPPRSEQGNARGSTNIPTAAPVASQTNQPNAPESFDAQRERFTRESQQTDAYVESWRQRLMPGASPITQTPQNGRQVAPPPPQSPLSPPPPPPEPPRVDGDAALRRDAVVPKIATGSTTPVPSSFQIAALSNNQVRPLIAEGGSMDPMAAAGASEAPSGMA